MLPTSARPCDLINHLGNLCLGVDDPETLRVKPGERSVLALEKIKV